MTAPTPPASGRSGAVLLATVVAVIALAVAAIHVQIAWLTPGGDFGWHAKYARDALADAPYPGHCLYHLCVNGLTSLAGSPGDLAAIGAAAALLLTVATLTKLWLTASLGRDLARSAGRPLTAPQLAVLLVVMAFVSATPNWWYFPKIYRGQFNANIWFNPTTTLLMPFAVGVALLMVRRERLGVRAVVAASAVLAASVFAKPNFAFCFLPAIALFAVLRWVSWRDALVLLVPASVAVLVVAASYRHDGSGSGIEWEPFKVWAFYTHTRPGSLLVSYAFPVAVTLLRPNEGNLRRYTWAAWVLTAVANAQFWFFMESGTRWAHGNLQWGAHVATYLLFVGAVLEWIVLVPASGRSTWRDRVLGAVLALHMAGGAMQFARAWMGLDSRA